MGSLFDESETDKLNSWLASAAASGDASIVGGTSLVLASLSAPSDCAAASYARLPVPFQSQSQSFPGAPYPSSQHLPAYPPHAYPDSSDLLKTARHKAHAQELEAWLTARIATSAPHPHPHPHPLPLPLPLPPPTSYSEERPVRTNDDDTMALLAQAELRAGLGGRGAQGGYPVAAHPSSLGASSTAPSTGPPPPSQSTYYRAPPFLAPDHPPPTPVLPLAKRRATGAPPLAPTSASNPAPSRTPANIPLSTYSTRATTPSFPPVQSSSASTSRSSSSTTTTTTKPVLLTAAQKKANHIASEQKRRAAIRNGYDGLCTVVPALRAAIDEFEQRLRNAASSAANGRNKKGDGKKRGGAGSGVLMGGIQVGGEKIDGRAGPKSEAVVLGKTVDHVRSLLDSRQQLLIRLSNAYATTAEAGLQVQGGRTVWDEHWDERADMMGDVEDIGEWSEDE